MTMKALLVCMVLLAYFARGDIEPQTVLSIASSDFAQRLHHRIAKEKENMVFSPLSIHSSMTMAYLGARFETADEMMRALNLILFPDTAPHEAYRDLIEQYKDIEEVEIDMTSAIYANPDKRIEQQYKDDAKNYYSAKVDSFDLDSPEGPEKEINDYMAMKTDDMIKDVVPKGSIDTYTGAVLASSLLFKGAWKDPFDKKFTRKVDFYKRDGSVTQVNMMHDDRSIRHKRDDDKRVDVAEFPFVGGRFSLYMAVPHQADGITTLESRLDRPLHVEELLDGLSNKLVEVAIPKFRIENWWELEDQIKELGIFKAFDPADADLTGISQIAVLHLSKVIHKALIDVQEAGTTNSSSVARWGKTLRISHTVPVEKFIANHPFMFFLRDNVTKHILLQGKYSG